MKQCEKCANKLGKTTKGKLCQNCYRNRNKSSNDNVLNLDNNRDATNNLDNPPTVVSSNEGILPDVNVYDLIKENLAQEKRHHSEITVILRDQISILQNELVFKNTLIESLMTELQFSRNNDCNTSIISSNKKEYLSPSSVSKHNSTLNTPSSEWSLIGENINQQNAEVEKKNNVIEK